MEDFENEEYINSYLYNTNYYNEYKILQEMGFNKIMIKKVYAYINPKSLEDAIQLMSKTSNNIYQHEFFPDKNNKCLFCKEEPKYHINYVENIKKENIIENELKDKINLNHDFENEELDNFKGDTILEAEIGDKVKVELSPYDLTRGRITWRAK